MEQKPMKHVLLLSDSLFDESEEEKSGVEINIVVESSTDWKLRTKTSASRRVRSVRGIVRVCRRHIHERHTGRFSRS